MQFKKIISLTVLPVVLALGSVQSAQAQNHGPYLGASWGAFSIDESELKKNDDFWKAFAGFQFSDGFGIEGSWVDFNRVNSGDSRFEADGKGLALVFSSPTSDVSSVFLKAGQFWWAADSAFGGAVGSEDGNDLFYGLGFNYGFSEHTALRFEWERYDVAEIKLDTASVGLRFMF